MESLTTGPELENSQGHKATLRPDQRLHKSAAYLSLLGKRDAGSGGLFG